MTEVTGGRQNQALPVRLRAARLAAGHSQGLLARRVGLTKGTLCDLERGRHLPSLASLARLAALLDVTTDWLLGLTDTPDAGALGELVYHAGQLSASNLGWLIGFTKSLVAEQATMRAQVQRWTQP